METVINKYHMTPTYPNDVTDAINRHAVHTDSDIDV